jgi:hypothetical protein
MHDPITDLGEDSDQTTLVDHVFAFYQDLMGSEGDPRAFSVSPHIWPEGKRSQGLRICPWSSHFTLGTPRRAAQREAGFGAWPGRLSCSFLQALLGKI